MLSIRFASGLRLGFKAWGTGGGLSREMKSQMSRRSWTAIGVQKDPVSHDLNSAFTSSWGMSLPSAICLSPSSKPAKKLGFLRHLLQFRTRKFWQLGRDFVETHLSILAHLDRVTPLNLTLNSAAAAPKASHCTCRDLAGSRHNFDRRNLSPLEPTAPRLPRLCAPRLGQFSDQSSR